MKIDGKTIDLEVFNIKDGIFGDALYLRSDNCDICIDNLEEFKKLI